MVGVKVLWFLLCLPLMCTPDKGNKLAPDSKIIGARSIKIKDAGFVAAIENLRGVFCGCCMIGYEWFVSAAHCVEGQVKSDIWIRTGADRRETGGNTTAIRTIYINPGYNNKTLENDISLIKTWPVKILETQYPIGVASWSDVFPAGTPITFFGWGLTTATGYRANVLQYASVPIINDTTCAQNYELKHLFDSTFCAAASGAAVCPGDSGGPGIAKKHLAGIISGGRTCAPSKKPNIFTRLTKFYFWIENITGLVLKPIP